MSASVQTATEAAIFVERPILFTAAMVWALLAGRKTVTRRPIRRPPVPHEFGPGDVHDAFVPPMTMPGWNAIGVDAFNDGAGAYVRCPYGLPGDRLWVKETHYRRGKWRRAGRTVTGKQQWRFVAVRDEVRYAENAPRVVLTEKSSRVGWYRRPSIFMPRSASRLTLEVTRVRAERVQEITHDEAVAEGMRRLTKDGGRTWKYGFPDRDGWPGTDDVGMAWDEWDADPVRVYARCWDSINAERGYPWSENPYAWAVTFRYLEGVKP